MFAQIVRIPPDSMNLQTILDKNAFGYILISNLQLIPNGKSALTFQPKPW